MINIHKTAERKDGKVRVTFEMPAIDTCDSLYLVGWFEEWDESVYRMQQTAEGTWSLTLELEPGCEYHYHFRTPDGKWLTDPAAPPTSSSLGSRNSFVISAHGTA